MSARNKTKTADAESFAIVGSFVACREVGWMKKLGVVFILLRLTNPRK